LSPYYIGGWVNAQTRKQLQYILPTHWREALIEEEFGDGIMSAIDFDLAMDRQADPKGDRARISMSGKFLPYKYYGATGNAQTYGCKELAITAWLEVRVLPAPPCFNSCFDFSIFFGGWVVDANF
jgi:Cyanate lyase C-terminal domain